MEKERDIAVERELDFLKLLLAKALLELDRELVVSHNFIANGLANKMLVLEQCNETNEFIVRIENVE